MSSNKTLAPLPFNITYGFKDEGVATRATRRREMIRLPNQISAIAGTM